MDSADYTPLPVQIRAARQADTPDVMALTANIWEGHDYVPHVWQEWLADPHGRLLVAERQGRVLGLSKLSRISEFDWWLQGLRVHPDYQGQGIASRLTEASLQAWLEIGAGTLRLTTHRPPVRHLMDRLGLALLGEVSTFARTDLLAEAEEIPASLFEKLAPEEAAPAAAFVLHSASMQYNWGLIDMEWVHVPPRPVYLEGIARQGQAWWWHGRQGLLAYFEDEDDDGNLALAIQFVACQVQQLGDCLSDSLRLAASLGYARASWMAPLHPEMLEYLEQAGFVRSWDRALGVYALEHPGKS
ncbi:MAG: GNAT family N-acetyltransferase [Chloroflexota bacterium]